VVYIAYQWPGKGFYPEMQQYINTPHVAHKTAAYERGGNNPNESLMYPFSGGTEWTYSAWCADLVAKGTKMIRIIWGGRQLDWGRAPIYDLEPTPAGTYNVWHSVLDDAAGGLTTYRAHQVSGSPGDPSFPTAYWTGSNIKQLLDVCEANGIEVWVELSHNREWSGYEWIYHPWNYGNYYIARDGSGNLRRCESQDRGFLSERWQVYTDADALQAMKDRVTFVIDLIGGYSCICMWGICSEQTWTFNPGFWGEESWSSTMVSNIRNYAVPWNAAVATHIRAEDPYDRPICASVATTKPDFTWPDGADEYRNVIMEPFLVYPIDTVATNLYQGDYKKFVLHLNAVREKIEPKRMIIHQYYPEGWELGPTAPLRTEYAPYLNSKRVEWLGAVLKWGAGPGRWMGLTESAHNIWSKGGYGDPDWYALGAHTATFRSSVNWKDWSGAVDWQDDVSSTGLDYILCTGDGDHFAGVLVWTSSGTKSVTISNVTDGAWTFKVFDWTDGSLETTLTPTAASNSLTISVEAGNRNMTVIYGEKD